MRLLAGSPPPLEVLAAFVGSIKTGLRTAGNILARPSTEGLCRYLELNFEVKIQQRLGDMQLGLPIGPF